MNISPNRRRILFLTLLLGLVGCGVAAYFVWQRWDPRLPAVDSPQYQEYVHAFQVSVAALEVTERAELARRKLDEAIRLVPGEPAAWANRGLLNLRQKDLEQAAKDLRRAQQLTPDSGEIESLLGFLAVGQGRIPEAISHLRAALAKNPRDVSTLNQLADLESKEGGADSDRNYQRGMEKILEVMPESLPVLTRRAGAADRAKDIAAVRDTVTRLDRLASRWSDRSRQQFEKLRTAVDDNPDEIAFLLAGLDNVLKAERGYSRDAIALALDSGLVGTPLRKFLRLPNPRPTPAPLDSELTFTVAPWASADRGAGRDKARFDVIRVVWQLSGQHRSKTGQPGQAAELPSKAVEPSIFGANAQLVRQLDAEASDLPFPGGPKNLAPTAAGVLAVDWDNDFRMDLLLAGAGGLRFWQQQLDGSFKDVTAKTGLPPDILGGDYYGAWAADLDMDGDLDIIVARRSGPALVLRNNGDGTFKVLDTFAAVRDVRAFVWADLDNDGANEAVLLDAAGKLHIFANERAGKFQPWPVPGDLGVFLAVTAADVNDDGVFDLVALQNDGKLMRISDHDKRQSWQTAELARWPGAADVKPGAVQLFVEDLDNNGAADIIVAGPKETHVFLADEQGRFTLRQGAVAIGGLTVIDLNNDGRLDFLGLSTEGQPVQALSRGSKNYHWTTILPMSVLAQGDSRINSFTLGGAIELRSGLIVQKQAINTPRIHFGLGDQSGTDLARFVWPNGVAQWEFADRILADRIVAVDQRLSGSCPFLFTHDGKGIQFVADFMWSTPLGMYVNGQNQGVFQQTTEWVKIRGDQLAPRDGYYDLRVHANLWETDYFDHLALIVVDHPPGTEIYADERFFLTPTPPELFVTAPPQPVSRAWDHHGQDATELVRAIDGQYLDRCGRGRFQGVTENHWVEADLGDDAPKEGPLWLIARGWLHPTDSSINVAMEQGAHDRPRALELEVPDDKGGWKVGRPALGFPAGKDKTMLVRLDGIDGAGVSRRFRLRTNMEIFWDFLGYAKGLDPKLAKQQRLAPLTAELRYRGILEMSRKNASSPEVPHYDKVSRGGQPWRDLTGYYTRFGDVLELLAKVDDRYVIMNAGDEIGMRFAVPNGPPPGWQRDFIWECDGWTKDGNPNTRNGTTVLPLPAHGKETNDRPPGDLRDDPVYRRFPLDWQTYHTRYVTPEIFDRGLRRP